MLTLVESWSHALSLLWEDAIFVGPLAAGFGVQVGLYTFTRRALKAAGGREGAITGVSPQTLNGRGVSVRVTPVALGDGSPAATFDVAMNTHSVDLSYDLAELATLRLDDGTELAASGWTGALGGHHVSGQLTFLGPDLAGVQSVELVLRDVADVPAWTFAWDVP